MTAPGAARLAVAPVPLPDAAAADRPLPSASYRVQLRNGMSFDRLVPHLPYLAELGIDLLYLSPIFTANVGSTHGYDVTRPDEIDPALGGGEGFARLAEAAWANGLRIILDIVPNHTAFSLDNPWLRDVLRHGIASSYARHFDIDWSKPQVVLPFLADPLEETLAQGRLSLVPDAAGAGVTDGTITVPLAPGPLPPQEDWADADALRNLLKRQHWRLTHWEFERDGLTHRRFFNLSELIGMRVEEAQVFDDMHALPIRLVREGAVHGLRIDHIDGLADPAAYLHRLRAEVGDAPLWVEKILTGEETLPDWPVSGTTGYEAGRAIAQVLTDGEGLARLDAAWREATGQTADFEAVLQDAKQIVMRYDLAGELHHLIELARQALHEGGIEAGDEALRDAVLSLLFAFPRYRTYFDDGPPDPGDLEVMRETTVAAAASLRSDAVLHALSERIIQAEDEPSRLVRLRFQQVTGALLAKAHEDTAGFRYSRYLAANEVGAQPDEAVLDVAAFSRWLADRAARGQQGLTLTSSHDTKRSEDARMRLVAMSHLPGAFLSLWQAAETLPSRQGVDADLRWYVVQSLLGIWQPGLPDLARRLGAHVQKAMREAKLVTTWSHPDAAAEGEAQRFAADLVAQWEGAAPGGLDALLRRGEDLSLIQLALKALMPGIPDIYQGSEGACLLLTDPDNRAPVSFSDLAAVTSLGAFDARKAALTRRLLHLRRRFGGFLASADAQAEEMPGGGVRLLREGPEGRLVLTLAAFGAGGDGWEDGGGLLDDPALPVRLEWEPAAG